MFYVYIIQSQKDSSLYVGHTNNLDKRLSQHNNPNGKSYGNAANLKLCSNFSGIVVVDETYADFSEQTALPLLKKVKNEMKKLVKSYKLQV